ncbi:MAG: hypothetical protein ACYDGR_06630 [Candidatus Dormibacteria bacterium]
MTGGEQPGILGPRFVLYLAGMMVVVGLFARSELVDNRAEAGIGLLVALLGGGGLGLALASANNAALRARAHQNYIIPLLAVLAGAGISYLAPDWRLHFASQAMMGLVFLGAAYVTLERFLDRERPGHEFIHDAAAILVLLGSNIAIVIGVQNFALKVALLAAVAFLTAYESFLAATGGDAKAPLYAAMVAQIVGFLAIGLLNAGGLDSARLALILLVAWYANRGVGYNILKGTLTRGILLEYGFAALLCLGLAGSALLNR